MNNLALAPPEDEDSILTSLFNRLKSALAALTPPHGRLHQVRAAVTTGEGVEAMNRV